MEFPKPPKEALDSFTPRFAAAPELREWAKETFLDKDAALLNEDHKHLRHANILFLWSSYYEKRHGDQVAGTAEIFQRKETRWKDGRAVAQVREWNEGEEPTFIITLCAPYCQEVGPEEICSLVEHEMYHCGQQRDEFGFPKFDKDGIPKFALRGHDVEEFIGVVRRYGPTGRNVQALADAAQGVPKITRERTKRAVCGCGAKV